ncbi:FAD-binding protein [Gudongella sp. DL1XJH-153]|uniref:FAD-binding protein n=1 Tax=Gudongella sp. DL1XJH-153 TaxID=3409804 RepID=UPI003BB7E90F
MGKLHIDRDTCIGCGQCISSCGSEALIIVDGKVIVNSNCILCGICVDACPVEAIKISKDIEAVNDLTQFEDIWIYGEIEGEELAPVVFELLSKAEELAKEKRCKTKVLIIGKEPTNLSQLEDSGADEVLIYKISGYEKSEETDIEIFNEVIIEYKPDILLFGATSYGRSIAPRVAARMKTGLTADCTHLCVDDSGILQQTRPAFGGNLMATIVCPNTRPQMATVRPGVFKPGIKNSEINTKVSIINFESAISKSIKILKETAKGDNSTIAEAEIILSVGRGIGSQKNLEMAEKLAELLGAKLGVSRALVDIGWKDNSCQIGQTGFNVSPKLLISIGISGAIQHLAGITNAEKIIAINTDVDAPIFKVADYKVVADGIEIIKEMINEIENVKF